MRALAKDPDARFKDADAFVKALDAAEKAPDTPRPEDTAAFAAVSPEGHTTVREVEEYREERDRPPWRWIILALLVAAVAGLVAFALTRPAQVDVPNVVGQDVGTATELLREEGFEVKTDAVFRNAPVDQVLEQDPSATDLSGEKADEGSTVTLSVSRGPGTAPVPDVSGLEEEAATKRIEDAGFNVDPEFRFDDKVPEDRVIGTEPAAGTPLESGATVTLLISRGSNQVEVPDVTGLDDQAALNALEDAELAGNIVQRDDEAPAGEVVAQSPGSGRMVPRNSQVTIFVSTGAITVPDVLGQARKTAVNTLKKAGFVPAISEETTTDPAEANRVINQFPPGGSRGQRGDTVTITVGALQSAPPPTP